MCFFLHDLIFLFFGFKVERLLFDESWIDIFDLFLIDLNDFFWEISYFDGIGYNFKITVGDEYHFSYDLIVIG